MNSSVEIPIGQRQLFLDDAGITEAWCCCTELEATAKDPNTNNTSLGSGGEIVQVLGYGYR